MKVTVNLENNQALGIPIPQIAEAEQIVIDIRNEKIHSLSHRYLTNGLEGEELAYKVIDKDKPFLPVTLSVSNDDKVDKDNDNAIVTKEEYERTLVVTPAEYDEEGNETTSEIRHNPTYPNVVGQWTDMIETPLLHLMEMEEPGIIAYLASKGVDLERILKFQFGDAVFNLNARLMYEASTRGKFDK